MTQKAVSMAGIFPPIPTPFDLAQDQSVAAAD